ncbi:DUF4834 family protein [Sinomicrobium sp.]
MQLLRTIFVIVIVYYVIRFLSRIFAPVLMRYAAQKAQERYQGQYRRDTRADYRQREGEVVIDKMPENKTNRKAPTSGKKIGEYIDFEEVD